MKLSKAQKLLLLAILNDIKEELPPMEEFRKRNEAIYNWVQEAAGQDPEAPAELKMDATEVLETIMALAEGIIAADEVSETETFTVVPSNPRLH